jgi:hypothetical protein
MNDTVQCPELYEDLRSVRIGGIHPTRDEEIQSERIEEYRELEQVLQVVR